MALRRSMSDAEVLWRGGRLKCWRIISGRGSSVGVGVSFEGGCCMPLFAFNSSTADSASLIP